MLFCLNRRAVLERPSIYGSVCLLSIPRARTTPQTPRPTTLIQYAASRQTQPYNEELEEEAAAAVAGHKETHHTMNPFIATIDPGLFMFGSNDNNIEEAVARHTQKKHKDTDTPYHPPGSCRSGSC